MKSKLLIVLIFVILLYLPKVNLGQAPNLGASVTFSVFTAIGAINNTGTTNISGDIGTNAGVFTGFPPGIVNGQIHVADGTSGQAATDVGIAYAYLDAMTCGTVIGTTLGNSQTLVPDVYCLGNASTLNGDLILDGQGNPDALFIFKINGALSTSTFSNILLINSASSCNVYWQINGEFILGNSSVFRGTIVSSGAIYLLESSSLIGRGLTTAGAITLSNNVVSCLPSDAGTINGIDAVCQGQTGIIFSVPIITNTTGYVWILPLGATITSGDNTNTISVDFNSSASSGNITVHGINSCGVGNVSPDFGVQVNPLPISFIVIGSSGYCAGGEGATIGLSGSQNGIDYQLQINGINSGLAIAGTGAAINFYDQTVAGIYTIIATNLATTCSLSMIGNITISIWPVPLTSAIYHQ